MSVISDLRQFFLPDPPVKRMEKKEPPPKRPRRPPRRAFKERPEGLKKFALETAHLPASIVDQIEADFKAALAFTYTGRSDYRKAYINAGISADEIPEEELEELPGASGIRIPILGWSAPSAQVWDIAKKWLRSVTTWSDISRALEADLIWKRTLAKWGVENLKVIEKIIDPKTKKEREGIFVLDKHGNVLETTRQIQEEYPLSGAIVEWVMYGDVRSQRIGKFKSVKKAWLGRVQGHLAQTEPSLWARIDEILDKDKSDKYDVDQEADLVNGLWRDFVGFAREGQTFGIPERLLDTLKLVEYRGFELEVKDLLDQWSSNKLFRVYLWTTKPFGLRVKLETATRRFLKKNPKVRSFFYKTFSPLLSKDLTAKLLDNGRLLPNRLVGAFLKRLTKERFPSEILAGLKGTLSPGQFKLIRGSTLAELDNLVKNKLFDAKAYKQLEGALYVKWRRWFLPGRFMEWAGRNLTKIQEGVFHWLEEQIVKKNLIGKALDNPIIRAAGSRDFVDRALGRGKGLKKVAIVAGARKAAAGAALALRRSGARAAAKVVVKVAQGASKLTGPVGAVITTVVTFFGGRVLKWVWEKVGGAVKAFLVGLTAVATIPLSIILAISGCSGALLLAPFFLLVFIIAPAFQGEGMGGMGPGMPGERFVEISKTANNANPLRLDLGADPSVLFTISYKNVGETKLTNVTIEDDYAGDHDGDIIMILDPGGGTNAGGKLLWNLPDLDPGAGSSVSYPTMIMDMNTEYVIINRVTLTATTEEGEDISVTAQAAVIVGEPPGQPPSGWPTESGCITQGPNTSGQEASHQGQEAIDIARPLGEPIYATHDGNVFSYEDTGTNVGGNYIYIISREGFTTLYAHLLPFSDEFLPEKCPVTVVAGQQIGRMGNTGTSSTGVHLHYEFLDDYRGEELRMEPPYIPSAIDSCVTTTECNCCFSGFNGLCGE